MECVGPASSMIGCGVGLLWPSGRVCLCLHLGWHFRAKLGTRYTDNSWINDSDVDDELIYQ